MANTFTSQTILDGDRNVVMLFTGVLDTSNEARTRKVQVSALLPVPAKLSVTRITHLVSNGLIVVLDWDATTPVRFAALSGYDEVDMCRFMGIPNNAGVGVTGDIYLTTLNWSGVMSYNLILEMVKR